MGEFASTLVARFHSKLGYDNFKQQQQPGFNFDEANNPGLLFLARHKSRRFAFLMSLYFCCSSANQLIL
jgi:hypothetical protein